MIYLLSRNFRVSCDTICDQHLNESILDACMSVSYYLWIFYRSSVAFDATIFFDMKNNGENQPESEIHRAMNPLVGRKDLYDWVVKSQSNYTFLIKYLEYMVEEYRLRHGSNHKVSYILNCLPKFPFKEVTDLATLDARILACDALYNKPKAYWVWTNRD